MVCEQFLQSITIKNYKKGWWQNQNMFINIQVSSKKQKQLIENSIFHLNKMLGEQKIVLIFFLQRTSTLRQFKGTQTLR